VPTKLGIPASPQKQVEGSLPGDTGIDRVKSSSRECSRSSGEKMKTLRAAEIEDRIHLLHETIAVLHETRAVLHETIAVRVHLQQKAVGCPQR
jgi:hypothetical protein